MKLAQAPDEGAYIRVEHFQTGRSSAAAGRPGHTHPDRGDRGHTRETRSYAAAVVQAYSLPFVQAGQEHFSVPGDVLTLHDHHLTGGLDVAERTSLRIAFL